MFQTKIKIKCERTKYVTTFHFYKIYQNMNYKSHPTIPKYVNGKVFRKRLKPEPPGRPPIDVNFSEAASCAKCSILGVPAALPNVGGEARFQVEMCSPIGY